MLQMYDSLKDKQVDDAILEQYQKIKFIGYDGNRVKYFNNAPVDDCVARSISIALEMDYKAVHDEITNRMPKNKNADMGVRNTLHKKYLSELGWKYKRIRKHDNKMYKINELPKDKKLIVHLAKHLTVLDCGSIVDTWDCSKEGKAIVYGYYEKIV